MSPQASGKPRIAVLVSGGGRSLENLAELIESGQLNCSVELVLSDRGGVKALERAKKHGIEAVTLPRADFDSTEAFSRAIFDEIEKRDCELIVLAGFLRLILVPEAWSGRVLNIHPSLLPAFGGKGYYGDRVHQAVLDHGVQFTGCTVHYVTNEYDTGPILLQRCIPVLPEDDAHQLAARVFEEEKLALPEAIRRHLSGRG